MKALLEALFSELGSASHRGLWFALQSISRGLWLAIEYFHQSKIEIQRLLSLFLEGYGSR